MHMVTFKSAGDADEELAKRGFVCKNTKDNRSNPGARNARASTECKLQDGRTFKIALSQVLLSSPSGDKKKTTAFLASTFRKAAYFRLPTRLANSPSI
jgi:hypothetical protein